YYAKRGAEGTYLVHSFSEDQALANQTSQLQSGLFGVVNVQPEGAEYYRSQVVREDLEKATYYVFEQERRELEQKRLELMVVASIPLRRQRAEREFSYLPKQSGVYYLDPPANKVTNMQLAV